ncbi:peptide ABC transporter ATP-binding protein [Salipaludibacillus keqinensis]|uniref:Peptide ABC transporter ATP-binding protein n=1 Tax=Salipaludibacillus keqinensis TaxID=2045207 RepID=A0A323TKJ5_9BACI|nr:ABC transporter ATP-binding protein [Salipaludibacillus keqinensis]PYZ95110.1 peptide ABC transporter ATP-binding protein [Salipaludibacillus keqinensis]
MSNERILDVKGLKTQFRIDKQKVAKAVDGIDFHINKGETLAIVGESGSGKSITALSIMQLIPSPPGKIVEGSIELDGVDLLGLSEKQMTATRGNDVAMIFQEPMTSLNPVFTIGTQVSEPLRKHKKLGKKEAKKQTIELLKLVGFPRAEDIFHEYPHQLSGGMRQRAMIAMALSCAPKLIIADEPTTALDVTIQAQILDLMLDMKKKTGSSILMITHDLGVVAETADRVAVMYAGQIVETSTVKELFVKPKHPYTVGLLNSMPKIDQDSERLESIPGMVPPAHNFPQGCRFAPRCKHAMDKCTEAVPDLIEDGLNHKVRCVLYDGSGKGVTHV